MTTSAAPPVPSSWTISSIATYAVAFVLFLFGVLTQAGVIIPANVSAEVQIWAGVIPEIASAVTALLAHVTNSSVVKATLKK